MKRVITALIGVPVVYSIVWFLPSPFTVALIVLSALVMLKEYFDMMKINSMKPFEFEGYLLVLLIVFLFYFKVDLLRLFIFIIPSLILIILIFKRDEYGKLLKSGSFSLMGIIYIGIFSGYLLLIYSYRGNGVRGRELLIYLISVIWLGDTGAYYIGRYFGKHPLALRLSPKKTVEGAIGGVIFAILGGLIMRLLLKNYISYIESILFSIFLSIMGQVGDLIESGFKRALKVKDSGTMLPGHGGVMDRMDGLIFSAPFMYLYIYFKSMVLFN